MQLKLSLVLLLADLSRGVDAFLPSGERLSKATYNNLVETAVDVTRLQVEGRVPSGLKPQTKLYMSSEGNYEDENPYTSPEFLRENGFGEVSGYNDGSNSGNNSSGDRERLLKKWIGKKLNELTKKNSGVSENTYTQGTSSQSYNTADPYQQGVGQVQDTSNYNSMNSYQQDMSQATGSYYNSNNSDPSQPTMTQSADASYHTSNQQDMSQATGALYSSGNNSDPYQQTFNTSTSDPYQPTMTQSADASYYTSNQQDMSQATGASYYSGDNSGQQGITQASGVSSYYNPNPAADTYQQDTTQQSATESQSTQQFVAYNPNDPSHREKVGQQQEEVKKVKKGVAYDPKNPEHIKKGIRTPLNENVRSTPYQHATLPVDPTKKRNKENEKEKTWVAYDPKNPEHIEKGRRKLPENEVRGTTYKPSAIPYNDTTESKQSKNDNVSEKTWVAYDPSNPVHVEKGRRKTPDNEVRGKTYKPSTIPYNHADKERGGRPYVPTKKKDDDKKPKKKYVAYDPSNPAHVERGTRKLPENQTRGASFKKARKDDTSFKPNNTSQSQSFEGMRQQLQTEWNNQLNAANRRTTKLSGVSDYTTPNSDRVGGHGTFQPKKGGVLYNPKDNTLREKAGLPPLEEKPKSKGIPYKAIVEGQVGDKSALGLDKEQMQNKWNKKILNSDDEKRNKISVVSDYTTPNEDRVSGYAPQEKKKSGVLYNPQDPVLREKAGLPPLEGPKKKSGVLYNPQDPELRKKAGLPPVEEGPKKKSGVLYNPQDPTLREKAGLPPVEEGPKKNLIPYNPQDPELRKKAGLPPVEEGPKKNLIPYNPQDPTLREKAGLPPVEEGPKKNLIPYNPQDPTLREKAGLPPLAPKQQSRGVPYNPKIHKDFAGRELGPSPDPHRQIIDFDNKNKQNQFKWPSQKKNN
ncbi:predicted protein [Chaetoceros tenuissimus]|uniref:Uncharacterized protein n=2 Tax=Chaetoceros tenuissimus TaxID=426638 RepID=A0AAD3H0Y3_9STRA|nr:predicted protein [Chaetoceros tenuissimus]